MADPRGGKGTVEVPLLTNIEGNVTPDGAYAWFKLTNAENDQFQGALNEETLGRLISFLLELANDSASKTAPESAGMKIIRAHVLQATGLGLGQGDKDTQVILNVSVGVARLAFAVEKTSLLELCKALGASPSGDQRKLH